MTSLGCSPPNSHKPISKFSCQWQTVRHCQCIPESLRLLSIRGLWFSPLEHFKKLKAASKLVLSFAFCLGGSGPSFCRYWVLPEGKLEPLFTRDIHIVHVASVKLTYHLLDWSPMLLMPKIQWLQFHLLYQYSRAGHWEALPVSHTLEICLGFAHILELSCYCNEQ